MTSYCTRRFWRAYEALPEAARKAADKNYLLWRDDPGHPSLQFKEIRGGFWSVRVGLHYRALAHRRGNDVDWVWIGTHAEYDRLIARG